MFVNQNRAKLINAINYFVRSTKHCHTLKLFKLLNFLDFEHFRQTGFSVTGLSYKAWPNGPAPSELWHELQNPSEDLRKSVSVTPVRDNITDETLRRDIKPRAPFDSTIFTKREMKILERLAFFFMETRGEDMSEFSHAKNLPWGKVYLNGKGRGRIIPYELSRESDTLIKDMPNISDEEFAYRKELFAEVR